jgi:hypothetical protein
MSAAHVDSTACTFVLEVPGEPTRTALHQKDTTMALYMFNIWEDQQAYAEGGAANFDDVMALHQAFSATVAEAGAKIVAGEALQPTSTATFLRGTCTDSVHIVDNPLPELKETLGGFYVVDVTDEAQAQELAKSVPASFGFVEVRPVWEFS